MKKNYKKFKAVISLLIFCLVAMTSFIAPIAKAASLTDVKDVISTSRPSLAATHTISFMPMTSLAIGYTYKITMPVGFNVGAAAPTCAASSTSASFSGQVLTCTVNALIPAGVSVVTSIANVTNPAKSAADGIADTYKVYIETQTGVGVVVENANAMVAIDNSVLMTATIESTLTFVISGVAAGQVINGITTTAPSTATTTSFGTLTTAASSTIGQQLAVSTNATDGYAVTVMQDHELLSNSGDTINSFANSPDGTGSTTPQNWVAPSSVLDQYNTYGHMGLTTNDGDLGGTFKNYTSGTFYGQKFAGLSGTTPMPVMSHDGPADGTTASVGVARVAYNIQIGALQEAGDYQSTLTYVCTPQY